ncbi:MAG: DUF1574 family protein [Leptospiraceae bacterium]
MEWKKRPFLIWPLVLISIAFCVDKIILIPSVREIVIPWDKIEPLIYESRFDLLEELKNDLPQLQKEGLQPGIILGSSRSAEFSNEVIARYVPGTESYNFSTPMGSPLFHYYFLDKILKAGIRPAYVMLELDPLLLSDKSMHYTLSYSLDPSFVIQHLDLDRDEPFFIYDTKDAGLSFDEAEIFFLKRAFAMYRFPVDVSEIQENLDEVTYIEEGQVIVRPKYDFRKEMRKLTLTAIKEKNGGIPNPIFFQIDASRMEEDAESVFNLHFSQPEKPGPALTQIQFFKLAMARLRQEGIPVMVYWPIVSPVLQKKLEKLQIKGPDGKENLLEFHRRGMQQVIDAEVEKGGQMYLAGSEMWQPLKCRAFVDSTHLSGACFDELSALIFAPLAEMMQRDSRP